MLGVRTLPELLGTVPGFNPWRSVAGDWWPGPRGVFDSNRSFLVMIDGAVINNQLLGSAYWSYDLLDLSRFSRIEIVRGPGSAVYGANAILAVINCITHEHRGRENTLRLHFGSYRTVGVGLTQTLRTGRTSIDFGFSGASSDGASSFVERDIYGKSGHTQEGFRNRDLFLKMENPSGWTFLLSNVAGAREGYVGYHDNLNDQTTMKRELVLLSFKYRHLFRNRGELLFHGSFNRSTDREVSQSVSPGGTYLNNVTYPLGATESEMSAGTTQMYSLQYNLPSTKNHQLSLNWMHLIIALKESALFGSYDFPDEPLRRVFIPGAYPAPETFRTSGFVVQDDMRLNSRTRLSIGFRYDTHSVFDSSFSPRLGLINRWSRRFTTKLLYGRAFRNPDFIELTTRRDLKPEKIETTEMQMLADLDHGMELKLSCFFNRLRDRIMSAKTLRDFRNIDRTDYDGIEFELRRRFSSRAEVFAVLSSFRLLNETFDPLLAPGLPHNRVTAGYSLHHRDWAMTVYGAVTAKQPRNWADARPAVRGIRELNLTVRKKKFLRENLELLVRAENLLDADNDFVAPGVEGGLNTFPQPGRSLSFELTWDM